MAWVRTASRVSRWRATLEGTMLLTCRTCSSVTPLSEQTLSAKRRTCLMICCPLSGISWSSKPDSASIESDSAMELETELLAAASKSSPLLPLRPDEAPKSSGHST